MMNVTLEIEDENMKNIVSQDIFSDRCEVIKIISIYVITSRSC